MSSESPNDSRTILMSLLASLPISQRNPRKSGQRRCFKTTYKPSSQPMFGSSAAIIGSRSSAMLARPSTTVLNCLTGSSNMPFAVAKTLSEELTSAQRALLVLSNDGPVGQMGFGKEGGSPPEGAVALQVPPGNESKATLALIELQTLLITGGRMTLLVKNIPNNGQWEMRKSPHMHIWLEKHELSCTYLFGSCHKDEILETVFSELYWLPHICPLAHLEYCPTSLKL